MVNFLPNGMETYTFLFDNGHSAVLVKSLAKVADDEQKSLVLNLYDNAKNVYSKILRGNYRGKEIIQEVNQLIDDIANKENA